MPGPISGRSLHLPWPRRPGARIAVGSLTPSRRCPRGPGELGWWCSDFLGLGDLTPWPQERQPPAMTRLSQGEPEETQDRQLAWPCLDPELHQAWLAPGLGAQWIMMAAGGVKLAMPTAHPNLPRTVSLAGSRRGQAFTDGVLGQLSNALDL
jgi:hypothetical protein